MHNFNMNKPIWAIGLMSGTSLDGIDGACLLSDGEKIYDRGPVVEMPYPSALRAELREILDLLIGIEGLSDLSRSLRSKIEYTEKSITDLHVDVVNKLKEMSAFDIEIVGFHGQTVAHRPSNSWTWQIGDARRLRDLTGIQVVSDFRSQDMLNGGQGAPLAPVYHRALIASTPQLMQNESPIVVANIGGVANITWIKGDDMIAFDTGPGNALLDDWVMLGAGLPFDKNGQIAAGGLINKNALSKIMGHPFFKKCPPKSLDRLDFDLDFVTDLSLADGAATLTAFTALSMAQAQELFPEKPVRWIIAGGGRQNATMMAMLRDQLDVPVSVCEDYGWAGNMIEAELMAFLGLRSIKGLPLSYPKTTGCKTPVTGGILCK